MEPRYLKEDYLKRLNVSVDLPRPNINLNEPRVTRLNYLKKLDIRRPLDLKLPLFARFGPNDVVMLFPEPNKYRCCTMNDEQYKKFLKGFKDTHLGGR